MHAVDGCGLVLVDAERGPCNTLRRRERVALPDPSGFVFLTHNQVPHGVGPPAELRLVPPRIRYAARISPVLANRIAVGAASAGAVISEFDT